MPKALFVRHLSQQKNSGSLISFDVFDTLITRAIPPNEIINTVAKRMASQMGLEPSNDNLRHLVEMRVSAWHQLLKKKANQNQYSEDGLSREMLPIWLELAEKFFSLTVPNSDSLVQELASLEEELEVWAIRPISSALDEIRILKSQGYRLIYISDMYLSKVVIDRMLVKCGYADLFENGFVSGEIGLLKRTGNLFLHIEESFKLKPKFHFGDNKLADMTMPMSVGIKSFVVISKEMRKKVKRSEKLWKISKENPEMSAFVMFSLLQEDAKRNSHVPDPWSYSLAIFTLITATYVENRHETVIMPAREGLALLTFFDQFSFLHLPQNRSYVMTSRKSVSPNASLGNPRAFFEEYLRDKPNTALIEIMRGLEFPDRVSLDLSLKYHINPLASFGSMIHDARWQKILSDEIFLDLWTKRGLSRRNDLSNLLEKQNENGIINDLIFVDLGWNGTIQNNLSYSLMKNQKIIGLYFGLNEAAFGHSASNSSYTSLITHQNSDFYSHSIFTCPNLLEILLLAPHQSPISVRETINIEEIATEVAETTIHKRKLSFQSNTLKIIKPLELGHLLFEPSTENYAQIVRTLISKMVFLPTDGFVGNIQNLETEFGYSEKKYPLITRNSLGKYSPRSSIWRYGASQLRFGKFVTMALIARDAKNWGMPHLKPTSRPSDIFGVKQERSIIGRKQSRTSILTTRYAEVLASKHIDIKVPLGPLTNNDVINLRTILSAANFYRRLKRVDRFDNFTLPTRELIRYGIFRSG
jgi:FMN phosphatase YigB (HAD superfamily)